MKKIIRIAKRIDDARQQVKVKHSLHDIIIIVLLGTTCGCDTWEEIIDFVEVNIEGLRKYIKLNNGIPSHDTLQRVMGIINPEQLEKLYLQFYKFLNTDKGQKMQQIFSIDGKTSRGSGNKNEKPIHNVSCFYGEDSISFGNVTVAEKGGELKAIGDILDYVNVKNQIITIDAAGTYKSITKKIISKKADYVLAVKGNQPTLHKSIINKLDNDNFMEKIVNKGNYEITIEEARGRLETREYYQTEDLTGIDVTEWGKIKTVGKVVSTWEEMKENGEVTINSEIRYYISSLSEDIQLFAKSIRGHWQVESQLHWQLDVTFKEDANKTLNKIAVQNMNIIRKWSLLIINSLDFRKKKMSMKRKRKKLGMDGETAIEKIMGM